MLINVNYDSSVTSSANAAAIEGAIQAAVAFYEHTFRDVKINLKIDFVWAPLSSATAENIGPSYTFSYAKVVAALKASGKSPDDLTAYATLPSTNPTGRGGSDFVLTRGQAEVLGLPVGASKFDDTITLNSNYAYTFDPSNRGVANEVDAIGALEHEISEFGMGRLGSMGSLFAGEYTPLDLFSYSSPGVRSLTNGAHYFSLDGSDLLQEYNDNAANGGDIADWLGSIQGDSYGTPYYGVVGQVTPTDLRELDILGWKRTAATIDDFSGDGVSDVLLRNNATGDIGYWAMNGSYQGTHDIGPSSTAYSVVGVGDFNRDHTDDILFRDPTTGDIGYFAMSNGGTGSGSGPTQGNDVAGTFAGWNDIGPSSTDYQSVGVGDFYGTGTDDILFRNNTTGDQGFFAIRNGAFNGWHDLGPTSTDYNLAGIGDFLGNGVDDILYRNNSTGDVGFFSMSNGVNTGWHDVGPSSTAYQVVGIGDFFGTGDTHAHGTDDILFRNNATGDFGFFAMSHGVDAGWQDLGSSPTSYNVVGTGDYYGNGTNDVLFRNASTGDIGFYSISNGANTGWHDIGVESTAYTVPIVNSAPIA